jgi:hypothetical protein
MTPSIQCAITAMNGERLGSNHKSMVKEIFPMDFYYKSEDVNTSEQPN